MPPELRRIYSWNDAEATDILRRAAKCVQDAEVPAYLQEIAFEKACALLSHHVPVAIDSPIALPEGALR